MSGNLAGQVALVTGASRGIGRAIAVALAARGCRVFVNYTAGAEAAQATVDACTQAGGSASAVQFDVASSEAADGAISAIHKEAGRLDVLVNNAGIARDGLLIRYKDEDWRRVLAVNLDGAFYCSRAAAKIMMRARQGRIINISSIVGEMGNPGQAAYVASKAGLIGLTKSMAKELAARNITVNAVTPGFIETDMTAALDPATREEMQKQIPLARLGSSEDIAAIVAFLAGSEASYITGQVIGVNGGMYM